MCVRNSVPCCAASWVLRTWYRFWLIDAPLPPHLTCARKRLCARAAEPAEFVAQTIVPEVRKVPLESVNQVTGGIQTTYTQFLTKQRAYSSILAVRIVAMRTRACSCVQTRRCLRGSYARVREVLWPGGGGVSRRCVRAAEVIEEGKGRGGLGGRHAMGRDLSRRQGLRGPARHGEGPKRKKSPEPPDVCADCSAACRLQRILVGRKKNRFVQE
eukprot:282160-Chlamydomonas_euryale.AAC.3